MNQLFFEWFYIDVHQRDGYDLVLSLHTHPFMSQFKICIFDVFVYYQNQPVFHRFFVIPQDAIQRPSPFLIEVQTNLRLRFEIKDQQAFLEFVSGQVQIQLELKHPKVEGLPLNLELFKEESNKSFQWKLFMPLARAAGKMTYSGTGEKEINHTTIDGMGYLDSNSGNINLKKELAYWLWAKIKWHDELIIAGKVKDAKGRFSNILVKCGKESIAVDEKAKIDFSSQNISINGVLGQFDFFLNEVKIIDDLRFMVSTAPGIFSLPMKIIEVMAGIAVQKKSLKWLAGWLTNGQYFRKRWLATTKTREKVEIFGEEMFLNE
ncbi:MAG: hypothetical protein J7L94_05750 [Caldisericaceae bacterium]|nr:hypothetical protein [Caldisericaceae bacterium]